MPAVQTGKVLVTGANGYIAVWLVKSLLEQGYSVRGTVRGASKGGYLKKIFSKYDDKLEIVEIDDITKDGAFDEAVKGVDGIEHTASPFHMNADEPSDVIDPAVAGTVGILKSALKTGTSVKRVVITSSIAAVQNLKPEGGVFNESHWNDDAIQDCAEKGRKASALVKYIASKTWAERLAWEWTEQHSGEMKFDIVTLTPPYVFGPFIHDVESPEKLNQSLREWYDTIIKSTKSNEELIAHGHAWVDVRDISQAHILALQREEAAGMRFIISSGKWVWQDWINTARKMDTNIPAGNTAHKSTDPVYPLLLDTSRSTKTFGIKYIDMEQCTKDMLAQFKEKKWY